MKKNINKDVIALALMLFSIIFLLIDYFLFNHTRAMIAIIIGGIAFLVSLSFAIYNYFKKSKKWINYLLGLEYTINNLKTL